MFCKPKIHGPGQKDYTLPVYIEIGNWEIQQSFGDSLLKRLGTIHDQIGLHGNITWLVTRQGLHKETKTTMA